MPDRPTFAIITTCKGRLHHLRQTLPQAAGQQPDELIVVDYACPDQTGAWVAAEFPQAKVVRAGAEGHPFNLADARNAGAAAATSDWILFVDADVHLTPGMLEQLRALVVPGHYLRPRPVPGVASSQIWGTFACPRAAFAAAGAYDAVIDGWGHEDDDLYRRLQLQGLQPAYFPADLLSAIAHGDEERAVTDWTDDRWENEAGNACYSLAKFEISRLRGGNGNLPLEERRKLMQECRKRVARWYADGMRQPLPVRFIVPEGPPAMLASQVRMRASTWVTVVLDPSQFGTEPPKRRKSAAPNAAR